MRLYETLGARTSREVTVHADVAAVAEASLLEEPIADDTVSPSGPVRSTCAPLRFRSSA